jgi:hypothetical protein
VYGTRHKLPVIGRAPPIIAEHRPKIQAGRGMVQCPEGLGVIGIQFNQLMYQALGISVGSNRTRSRARKSANKSSRAVFQSHTEVGRDFRCVSHRSRMKDRGTAVNKAPHKPGCIKLPKICGRAKCKM